MDLTKQIPRSPFDMNYGIVMLPRTTDKAKASNAGKLGEYHYNCPLDKPLLEFLRTDSKTFAAKIKELETDEKISAWLEKTCKKSQKEKDSFNNKMRHSAPKDKDSLAWMESEKKKLGRNDYFTYFDNIDADEKRF
ncbi:MAG TPA: DUF5069 domain-containing protein [Candidatus Nanoarchaeia archaeon]|nr:DUF5069 domain-containing protein [Candidatus Nanoarchaeia archaeon]